MNFKFSNQFKKDLKKAKKQGKDFEKLYSVIGKLLLGVGLEDRYKAHALVGNWSGYWDLHLEPDWLLIYKITDTELYLARMGSHSELFG